MWREYANRIEWDDPEVGSLRPEMCGELPVEEPVPFDMEKYFERCWREHCEVLRLNAMLDAA